MNRYICHIDYIHNIMESKLNHTSIEQYSKKTAKILLTTFFSENESISGQQILNFSEINQVNLFVLKHLFISWEKETEKLKSPYFDFETPKVKESLKDFMNLLSQNIKIKRSDFEPLVVSAIKDTILIVISPYDYYRNFISNAESGLIKLESLKQRGKYVKINKFLYNELWKKIEEEKKGNVSSEIALKYLDEVIGSTSEEPDDFEKYVAEFSKIEMLDVNSFYDDVAEEDIVEESHINDQQEDLTLTVNEKFTEKIETINDKIQIEVTPTIADQLKNDKIASLKSDLSINQKYMFINELFDGNTDNFNASVEKLETCTSYKEAFNMIENDFAKSNHWKKESDVVDSFLNVVKRRFV